MPSRFKRKAATSFKKRKINHFVNDNNSDYLDSCDSDESDFSPVVHEHDQHCEFEHNELVDSEYIEIVNSEPDEELVEPDEETVEPDEEPVELNIEPNNYKTSCFLWNAVTDFYKSEQIFMICILHYMIINGATESSVSQVLLLFQVRHKLTTIHLIAPTIVKKRITFFYRKNT